MLTDTARTDALIGDMARALRTKSGPEGHAAGLPGQFTAGFGAEQEVRPPVRVGKYGG